jgi:HAD superfamily hydrolase (TIGR01509 family)
MTAEALVFDMGGVLVDIDFGRAFALWGAAAGVPAAALAARYRVDEACCAHERGELDDRAYFAHLRRTLGVALPDEAMLAGWNAIIGEPMPGIEALVRELAAKRPLYVFSNTNPAHIAHFTPRFAALLGHFRRTFTSCELGRRKPETEAFARLATRIGAPASRLAFFDDVAENVLGARNAGLQAFRVASAAEIRAIAEDLLAARTAR